MIPTRKDQRRLAIFDREAYLERLINRMKQFRRIATRYEKRAANYLAMVIIVMIVLWLPTFADRP